MSFLIQMDLGVMMFRCRAVDMGMHTQSPRNLEAEGEAEGLLQFSNLRPTWGTEQDLVSIKGTVSIAQWWNPCLAMGGPFNTTENNKK